MRRAARVDENQARIVAALRCVGASVQSLASVGKGCADLLVGYRLRNYLLEVKNPEARRDKQALTPAELKWHQDWRGRVVVVRTIQEAFAACEVTITHKRDAGFPVTPPEPEQFDTANWKGLP